MKIIGFGADGYQGLTPKGQISDLPGKKLGSQKKSERVMVMRKKIRVCQKTPYPLMVMRVSGAKNRQWIDGE